MRKRLTTTDTENLKDTIWIAVLLTHYSFSVLWFFVLYPKAVAAPQKTSRGSSVLIGALAYTMYKGMFEIFNR